MSRTAASSRSTCVYLSTNQEDPAATLTMKALLHRHGYDASLYGHFGDGLVHCRIPFDLRTEAGLRTWQRFLEQASDLVVRYGGSISGEHGDGQARGQLLERMYGPELTQAFREFKAIWDPAGRMNPGKVIDPFPITSNLRVGPSYQPAAVKTHFAYPEDGGSFSKAMTRCVGVGACRRRDSNKGVMCPSYMATNEEMHSTRGRARLLFEMLHGGPLVDRWRSNAVEEALDVCLSCKGCKSDCPVNVDMAKYKAEFRAHHYQGRLRPRAAYSMGLIQDWSRLAGAVPNLANAALQTTGIGSIIKWIAGIAPQRKMPRYAPEPFHRWFRRRLDPKREGPRVLLWPDTFNAYFRPPVAIAATRTLEALGYQVDIPTRRLCCGRPLYDWGMLGRARKLWNRTLQTLEVEIETGTPIIGLEPACTSAFRDELGYLFPADERATQLARQVHFFSDFLTHHVDAKRLPHISGSAMVQFHCHQHAVLDTQSEVRLLQRLGLRYEVLKSGCCGMAGSGSSAKSTRSHSWRLNEACCRKCVNRIHRPSCWQMASVAANRLNRRPVALPCTSPSCLDGPLTGLRMHPAASYGAILWNGSDSCSLKWAPSRHTRRRF